MLCRRNCLLHEHVDEPHGCAVENCIKITGQLETTKETNNRDRIEGFNKEQLYLRRHAFCRYADVLQNRMIVLRRCPRQLKQPVVDSSTKTTVYCMDDFEDITQMFPGEMPVCMLRLGGSWLFAKRSRRCHCFSYPKVEK